MAGKDTDKFEFCELVRRLKIMPNLFVSTHVILHPRFDVTEAQLFLIGVQLWTGAFGAGLWNVHLYQGKITLLNSM